MQTVWQKEHATWIHLAYLAGNLTFVALLQCRALPFFAMLGLLNAKSRLNAFGSCGAQAKQQPCDHERPEHLAESLTLFTHGPSVALFARRIFLEPKARKQRHLDIKNMIKLIAPGETVFSGCGCGGSRQQQHKQHGKLFLNTFYEASCFYVRFLLLLARHLLLVAMHLLLRSRH